MQTLNGRLAPGMVGGGSIGAMLELRKGSWTAAAAKRWVGRPVASWRMKGRSRVLSAVVELSLQVRRRGLMRALGSAAVGTDQVIEWPSAPMAPEIQLMPRVPESWPLVSLTAA